MRISPSFFTVLGRNLNGSCCEFGQFSQIGDEVCHFAMARFVIGCTKNGRRVHGGHDVRCERGFEKFAAALRDAESAAEQSLCGGGTEADDNFGLQQSDFGVEPRATGGNFVAIWLLMDAPFATRFPLEMFHDIGDVNFGTVHASFIECGVKKFSGRADKWLSLLIFLVAGLFTDKEDSRFAGAFAENGLRGSFVKVAGFAFLGAGSSLVDGFGDGQYRRSGIFGWRGCNSAAHGVFRARFGFGDRRHRDLMRVTKRRCRDPGNGRPSQRCEYSVQSRGNNGPMRYDLSESKTWLAARLPLPSAPATVPIWSRSVASPAKKRVCSTGLFSDFAAPRPPTLT